MMDRSTGRSRGFGFVTMSTTEEAQEAVEAMNGTSLDLFSPRPQNWRPFLLLGVARSEHHQKPRSLLLSALSVAWFFKPAMQTRLQQGLLAVQSFSEPA